MKIRNFYRTLLALLLAFFNVYNGTANSYDSAVPDLDPRNYDYLQEDQNTTAHLFEEITNGGPLQIITKNDLSSGTGILLGKGFFDRNFSEQNKLTSQYIRDKKNILKVYIFPFHLFW